MPRRGFTLVELLVAATIALAVMASLASLLGVFSRTASTSQSIMDMTSRMRWAANRLRQDLAGLTAPLRPPLSPESNAGYFELLEGPWTDYRDSDGNWITDTSSILGDTDDALLFTTRSGAVPFRGRYGSSVIESSVAEVAWFCTPATEQPVPGLVLQTLYRRQLLVVGYLGGLPGAANNGLTGTLPAAYNTYDISFNGNGSVLSPNTLADLTLRENRFLHGPSWRTPFSSSASGLTFDSTSGREGEDVVLTNVIGFDVRVFDPEARPRGFPIFSGTDVSGSAVYSGTSAVYPSEQNYLTLSPTGTAPFNGFSGCFLDLGQCSGAGTTLSGSAALGSSMRRVSLSGAAPTTATYDTWSSHFESNGIDDDGDSIVDDGTNGLDDNGDDVVDDANEKEVPPPYAPALTAIEVRVRCYDPSSKEIRQTTVRQFFSN